MQVAELSKEVTSLREQLHAAESKASDAAELRNALEEARERASHLSGKLEGQASAVQQAREDAAQQKEHNKALQERIQYVEKAHSEVRTCNFPGALQWGTCCAMYHAHVCLCVCACGRRCCTCVCCLPVTLPIRCNGRLAILVNGRQVAEPSLLMVGAAVNILATGARVQCAGQGTGGEAAAGTAGAAGGFPARPEAHGHQVPRSHD